MQIDINGKRNITLDFNAPKKFRLTQNGAEIPYIRTGKNSFRLSKNIDGVVDLEEIIEPVKLMQPVALQPQQMAVINSQDVDRLNEAVKQMALVNPADVLMINNAADQLERTQNFISEEQKKLEQSQIYLDNQQQKLNESTVNIQALETNNAERLDFAEISIYNIAEDLDTVKTATLDNINSIDTLKAESLVTQATLETKADKTDVDKIKEELNEYKDDNESFKNALSNYSGGLAVEYSVSEGGKDGQILTKITDETGVYGWKDPTPVIVKAKKMPNPSAKLKGEVYQYVGETGTYTHGFIYECQKVGNAYQWVRIDVQPNTAVWGQITGTLIDQTDLQTALNGKQDTLVSGTNIKTINSNSILGSGNLDINGLPTQTGQSGKFLTTDGTDASWATVDALPDQTGQSGKFLTTDGTDASWTTVSVTVDQVYDSTSANAQSGVAINGAGFLNNTASGTNSLSILGSVIAAGSATAVGVSSDAGANGVSLGKSASSGNGGLALGTYAKANGSWATAVGNGNSNLNNAVASGSGSIAIGHNAQATASDAIQIGEGVNATADSLQVESYSLLNTSTGIIPYQRINAITDSNAGGQLKTWSGTKAEYDAIVTKDANTLYNITDDTDVSLTILEALYPVGSIYITTNAACPLSTLIAGSTWVLVGQDRVLQGAGTRGAVGTTLNESLPNITGYIKGGITENSNPQAGGAFNINHTYDSGDRVGSPGWTSKGVDFDASRSSSTYQDNAPVQPDAYLVNIFRRIS